MPDSFFSNVRGVVQLHGVDVLPARAGQAERVLDVVESLVDLLDEVRLDLACLTVPAAYGGFYLSGTRLGGGRKGEILYLARLPRSRLLLVLLGCNVCAPSRIPRSLDRCSTGDVTWLALSCKYICKIIDSRFVCTI